MTVLASALCFLAITGVLRAPTVFWWKVSILATEYGHWFAALSMLILLVVGVRSRKQGFPRFQTAALVLSLIIFSRPLVLATIHENKWAQDLHQTFSLNESPSLFSFLRLWKFSPKINPPERFVYAQHEQENLTLDFYRPQSDSPTPFLVVVHAGGWDSGSPAQLADLNPVLAKHGIAVAAISYRLAPHWKWPAQHDDVHAAVTYLKAHAKELNLDPNRWALLGRSAGGHIAESVAYQGKDASLKGVIAYYTPADLNFSYRYTVDNDIINSRQLLINLLGGTPANVQKTYDHASPILSANVSAPPTLLVHGWPDPLTWVLQSRRLHQRLKKEGARSVYIELPWATHAFDFNLNGPAGQIATNATTNFLKRRFQKET